VSDDKHIVRVTGRSRDPMARLPKVFLCNSGITFRAKGILGYLLSREPSQTITISDIVAHGCEGTYCVRQALYELQAHGYARFGVARNSGGNFSEWEWQVSDRPIFLQPDCEI
jgi:hypothetical protein